MNMYWILFALLVLMLLSLVFYFPPSTKLAPPPPVQRAAAFAKPAIPVAGTFPGHVVKELASAEEAKEFIKKKGLLMTYATWCGHCKNMMPALEEASTKTSVPFARLETSVAGDFLRIHEVRGFPTILLSDDAGGVTRHTGGRDVASLLAAVN